MSRSYEKLIPGLVEFLEKNTWQTMKQVAEQLNVNRTFLSGYLKALENQEYIESKKIGPANVYFKVG